MSPDRATWAYVADALIAHHTPKTYDNIDEYSKINIFLQSWNTDVRKLPKDLQDMIKVAKKHNLRLDGLAFSRDTIRQMPLWLHSECKEIKSKHNNPLSKCLRENHKVRLVGDAETFAKHSQMVRHQDRRNCACAPCTQIRRATECRHPNRCYRKARELLLMLPQKWNPMHKIPADYEPSELEQPLIEDGQTFDWRVTSRGGITDAFRIFTEGEKCNTLPDTERTVTNTHRPIEAFTDGSCMHNGTDDASAGAGVFFPNGEYSDCTIRLPNNIQQSNQTAEIIAIKEAVEITDTESDLIIHSDSKTMLQGLTTNLQKWEDTGFMGRSNCREI
ncbi:hypothetical protein EV368DRAFT_30403 [Lentinula lateritia]|nr:hypothetical protein EV368DRAFT_30403 [Lentinula lateritia]